MRTNLEKNIQDDDFSYQQQANDLEAENRMLRETIFQLKVELDRFKAPALMLAEAVDLMGNTAIIKVPNGNRFLVNVSKNIKDLGIGDTVIVEQKNLTIVEKLDRDRKSEVEQFVILEKTKIQWKDIGGLKEQIEEIKEVDEE